ncbi:MAG TPA: HPF/RaiA family ribosome-associated protein [Flavobacterium sp.]|nr:HPF/RaiA family ribosome-associated protein [Flavobacterium sp.]
MQIQFNTDNVIEGNERMQAYFTSELESKLHRFEDKITRIEIHLGDENSDKFGLNDKRCMIEARLAGMKPVAVTNNADTIEKAFGGAADKIKKVLDTAFDKLKTH